MHRSFELDRHTPASSDRARRRRPLPASTACRPNGCTPVTRELTALGTQVGFIFDFDRVRLGNTFDAHRLTQAARGTEWEAALVQRLFNAPLTEGRQLSDHDVLRDVARAAGLPEQDQRRGARELRPTRRRGAG